MPSLNGTTVALAVTGSIAAFKAPIVARLLLKAGARVIPVMTPSAKKFVGAATMSGITSEPVCEDMWDPAFAGEMHVDLGDLADVVLIVPATADVLARLAHGRADDLVTALALSARGPVLAAPAMHPRMWSHPATQGNVALLGVQGRVTLIGPVHGEVASGDVGTGRMSEPEDIVAAVMGAVAPKDLVGKRVLVTAGPTLEDMDPVRFLGNRSSGKMGFAVAERAAARGADVTLVAGPVSLPTPPGVRRLDVRSAIEMKNAIWEAASQSLAGVDAIIMAAAVADYRFAEPASSKTKKRAEKETVELLRNPDVIAEIGAARKGGKPVLVAFALETLQGDALVAEARRKLRAKKVDLVVANEAADAFGKDTNRVLLVTEQAEEALPTASKAEIADAIVGAVQRHLG